VHNGSCLCGDIQWTTTGDFTAHLNCHCSICRKVHGSGYGAFVAAPASGFKWISGEDTLKLYQSSEQGLRPFCPRCGSCVATVMGETAFMPAGNLDGDIDRPLDQHIFVAHKAQWFDISDAAQQFDEYSPDYDGPSVDRPEHLPETPDAVGGSCACGKVRYEFDGPADMMCHCHCSRCRKARGAPFSSQAFVAMDRFRWLDGTGTIDRYKVPDSKHFEVSFCRDCSSPVPVRHDDFGIVMLPAGSIDQDPGIRPQMHIYVGSRAPWFDINDDLPQFEEMPPR
jgi:hypothetical protein